MSYPERLKTFEGFWDDCDPTARQLAAIGHVYDRPPLESLEEGSRCIVCSQFVPRELSVRALDGRSGAYSQGFAHFNFHRPRGCDRQQIRIPLEPQAILPGFHNGYRFKEMRSRFEQAPSIRIESGARQCSQTSFLFSLPTELRLEIYAMILPCLPKVTSIVPLNSDSARVVTTMGYWKTGPRNLTQANILRSCRAVHDEALGMLYSNTTFKFTSTKILYLFLRHVGPHGRRLLKAIDIQCGFREDAIALALLASCENLHAITIRLTRSRIVYPSMSTWSAEGAACLLHLSGLREVHFAPCDPATIYSMDETKPDAAIIRRELTRPKGTAGAVRWVNGQMDV